MERLDAGSRQELLDRFQPAELPRLNEFLASCLHEEWALDYASPAEAVYEFLAAADIDDVHELAREWEILVTLARESSLDELNRLLAARFGSRWVATSRAEIEAVRLELERALAE